MVDSGDEEMVENVVENVKKSAAAIAAVDNN